MTEKGIELFNIKQMNGTKKNFIETKEGFSTTNPNVGTITHEFTFVTDPWQISSTDGKILFTLSDLRLSVSKVFNPNNTTDSFYVLSWNPNYSYRSNYSDYPTVLVNLLDINGASFGESNLGELGAACEFTSRQSKRSIVNSVYFDRITSAVFSLGPATWVKC